MAPKARRIKSRGPLFALISAVVIVAAAVLAVSIFFRVGYTVTADGARVSNVTVEGNGYYTAEEIVEASGIEGGDNLLFINRGATASRIYSRLPYIERADVALDLPNKVTIRVTESRAVAYVAGENGYWAVDRTCKLLSQPETGGLSGLIRVEGLTPIAPAVGQRIEAGLEENAKVTYLSAILGQMEDLGLLGDVTWIDMSNVSNPSFDYFGRFTVKLGTNEDLEYKFQVLLSAVATLSEGDRGTLDLGIDKRAHLTYD